MQHKKVIAGAIMAPSVGLVSVAVVGRVVLMVLLSLMSRRIDQSAIFEYCSDISTIKNENPLEFFFLVVE